MGTGNRLWEGFNVEGDCSPEGYPPATSGVNWRRELSRLVRGHGGSLCRGSGLYLQNRTSLLGWKTVNTASPRGLGSNDLVCGSTPAPDRADALQPNKRRLDRHVIVNGYFGAMEMTRRIGY